MIKQIRNFSIIAHIDHGKSTLADRFLEITGTIPKDKLKSQYLDRMDLEKEKGITIKLTPVTMKWKGYQLNLIDTPGHVDFSYEVSRSLAAVEGAILLVDATQGIEAQTLSNFLLAQDQGLTIIPVINKVDLPNAQVEKVSKSIEATFGFRKDEILSISAKFGTGIAQLLDRVIEKLPGPSVVDNVPPRALIFDSVYDSFKGAIAYLRVFDGSFTAGEKIKFFSSGGQAEILEVGFFTPAFTKTKNISSGEIGYIATGLKNLEKIVVGDTVTSLEKPANEPLPGYKQIKPMVFAGIFPVRSDDFPKLKDAIEKLKLNDASLVFEAESSSAFGLGIRAGFLGLLHMEVVQERLEREFDLDLIITSPSVNYKVILTDGRLVEVPNPTKFPDESIIKEVKEPWIIGTIVTLSSYIGPISKLVYSKRGQVINTEYFSEKVKITTRLPLSEALWDFYDKLKTVSSGYASFDWQPDLYRTVEAVKLEVLVAKEPVDALSQIIPKERAYKVGKNLVQSLKEVIPRQQFEVSLQASIGGKIIAADRIPPFRKDVTAKLYGGDRTRKDKLLKKQKVGKSRMKRVGKIDIPQEAFLSILKN